MTPGSPATLSRTLGLGDAVVIGLAAMIGAGVFTAFAPAAAAAGSGLLLALVVAAAVAYANATSSARLAAVHPESGGTYAAPTSTVVAASARSGATWPAGPSWSARRPAAPRWP